MNASANKIIYCSEVYVDGGVCQKSCETRVPAACTGPCMHAHACACIQLMPVHLMLACPGKVDKSGDAVAWMRMHASQAVENRYY